MKNFKALIATAKADLISTFKNPQGVFFGILFPLIFIAIFGFMDAGGLTFKIAVYPNWATENLVYEVVEEVETFEFVEGLTEEEIKEQLEKGELDSAIMIRSNTDLVPDLDQIPEGAILEPEEIPMEMYVSDNMPVYEVTLYTSVANQDSSATVASIVTGIVDKVNLAMAGVETPSISLETEEVAGRKYSQIDFVLPGQIGFALLNSGVMGTAFLLVSLRETLVLKRFFATPVRREVFIGGIALSKLAFAMVQTSVLILVGYFFFDFTLVNGFETFISMLVAAAFGITAFLGLGLIVSSLSKDQNTIGPIANIITIPQFILAGTFFPIEFFPEWLQPISKILPLTYLNDAMRKIAFDGESIFTLQTEFIALTLTIVVVYIVAVRTFKWEY
jgi:ABC-2 type transport system permease protein